MVLKAIGLISETFKTVESSYSAQDGKITVRKDRQKRASSCVSRGPVYIECSLTFHRADGRELPLAVDVVTETPVFRHGRATDSVGCSCVVQFLERLANERSLF